MQRWIASFIGLAMLLGAVVIQPTSARAREGSIAGTVRNEKGETVAGVNIEATSPALLERQRVTLTDDNGRYHLPSLREGAYRMRFILQHAYDPEKKVVRYDCAVAENVAVAPDQQTIVDAVVKFCGEDKVTIIN